MNQVEDNYPDIEKRTTTAKYELWRIFHPTHKWRWIEKERAIRMLRHGWKGKETP